MNICLISHKNMLVDTHQEYIQEWIHHALSVALEWAATASSAMAASTGCTRNSVGSSA